MNVYPVLIHLRFSVGDRLWSQISVAKSYNILILTHRLQQGSELLTSGQQRRCIHNLCYRSKVLRRFQRLLHVWLPALQNQVRIRLEVHGSLFLRRLLRYALETQAGAKFTECQPRLDASLKVPVNLDQIVYVAR